MQESYPLSAAEKQECIFMHILYIRMYKKEAFIIDKHFANN